MCVVILLPTNTLASLSINHSQINFSLLDADDEDAGDDDDDEDEDVVVVMVKMICNRMTEDETEGNE